ncbi:MAG: helix-turn-helix domain-containing protein [Cryobacterium sp.]|nr:helix-turn-helix domain-containing protein [Cryobacterium sp.]MCW5945380.1 helix-turn-helix domain-containing protein [Cryobacterium sp.]
MAAVAAISDPQRRALFDFVCRSEDAVSREDASSALGMPRSTAAFHLDRLAEEGMLEVEFRRLSGRTGPGAGRPSKLYRRAAREISVTFPARRYELAGDLLAAAVEESDSTGEPVREVLTRVAADTGRRIGEDSGDLDAALESCGYGPRFEGGGKVVLTNCPFHQLARSHADIICHANCALLEGMAEGAGEDPSMIRFVAPNGGCCVEIARDATEVSAS